jgi:hypothetical protein
MLGFLFALLLTIIWGLFALAALCLASAADDHDDLDLHDHDRSMTGD